MQHRLSELLTPELRTRARILETRSAWPRKPIPDHTVTGLTYDSRKVDPGFIYFALPGLHADGRDYIPQAIKHGAVAVVHQETLAAYMPNIAYIRVEDARFAMSPFADAFWAYPSRSLAVVGVTGTEGKSTTVFLTYQLLDLAKKRVGFVSTVQYRSGDTEEWNPEHQTTPEAPTVHGALAAMRDNGMEYAVLEASSHGLSPRTNRLGDVAFDVAVMTNVTHEHLEFHGSREQYRDDKANLFRALDLFPHEKVLGLPVAADASSGAGAVRIPAFGVANADDESAGYFASATKLPVYTFSGKGADADLSLRSITPDIGGNSYEILVRETGRTLALQDRLPGAFNALNVMAALLVVSGLLERSVEELAPLVPLLRPVRGRMSVVDRGQKFEVLVDYAHTPSSFETVLPPLEKRVHGRGGRLISLFGSGGERDREKRPRQGRIAADWSDIVILADEDPRGEDPMELLEEIAAGCPEKMRDSELFLIPDRPTAIRKAFSLAKEGDLVLLLGKGHENSIIYRNETRPYDEIAEAEKALAEAGCGDTR